MRPQSAITGIADLPATIPIFPLHRVLLLPRGQLPLNIFEPRYLAMTRDALAGHQLIGMLQPQDLSPRATKPAVYRIGCAGRIISAADTDNGRMLISLQGVCRFRIIEELDVLTPYRQVQVDYGPFAADLEPAANGQFDRKRLLTALRSYLQRQNMPADWQAIETTPDEDLVHLLGMICPFTAGEKQALLEAPHFTDRAQMIISLLEMALLQQPDGAGQRLN